MPGGVYTIRLIWHFEWVKQLRAAHVIVSLERVLSDSKRKRLETCGLSVDRYSKRNFVMLARTSDEFGSGRFDI